MAFLNPASELKRHDITESLFFGVVVNDDDPMKLNRVRVRVEEIYGNIPDSVLPWATVFRDADQGTSNFLGKYAVPQTGSKVIVQFHDGDVYSPIVVGIPMSRSDRPSGNSELDENYPKRMSYKYLDGTEFHSDGESGLWDWTHNSDINLMVERSSMLTLRHPSGTHIIIHPNGKVDIFSQDTINIKTKRDTNINADGSIFLKGQAIVIQSTTGNIHVNKGFIDRTGDLTTEAGTSLDHHRHRQYRDSDGDSQQDSYPPVGGSPEQAVPTPEPGDDLDAPDWGAIDW